MRLSPSFVGASFRHNLSVQNSILHNSGLTKYSSGLARILGLVLRGVTRSGKRALILCQEA